jgi:hypothetical protein
MPTMTTLFRAIVMIATGILAVKGWQLYGPSTEQVKTFAVAGLEKAQAVLNDSEGSPGTPAVDPRTAPQLRLDLPQTGTGVATSGPEAPQLVPVAEVGQVVVNPTSVPTEITPPASTEAAPADPVQPLLTYLQNLGVMDAQVSEWGASGGLFRCSCRAMLEDKSSLARHFEAVADEPAIAVEQVVAKVEAWRSAEQALMR